MADSPLDTNVIVRFLVERPDTIAARFKGVFHFFERIESGDLTVYLPDLVLFQSYFVLTSHYCIPAPEVADKLGLLISFRGIHMTQKAVAQSCMKRLCAESMDLVDAWIWAWSSENSVTTVFSFDDGLRKCGLKLLPVD